VHNNEQITYLGQFLNVSKIIRVRSPDKILQIVHLSRLGIKPRAWKCDIIGSIFRAVPPAGSGWRLTQKPRQMSTELLKICRLEGILELKLNPRLRVSLCCNFSDTLAGFDISTETLPSSRVFP
jgi:hypothetical protein